MPLAALPSFVEDTLDALGEAAHGARAALTKSVRTVAKSDQLFQLALEVERANNELLRQARRFGSGAKKQVEAWWLDTRWLIGAAAGLLVLVVLLIRR